MVTNTSQYLREVCRFTDEGLGFAVLCRKRFENDVIPLYFKHSSMRSFMRQLNNYGFTSKWNPRLQSTEFCHRNFMRNVPASLSMISRRTKPLHPSKRRRPGPRAGQISSRPYYDEEGFCNKIPPPVVKDLSCHQEDPYEAARGKKSKCPAEDSEDKTGNGTSKPEEEPLEKMGSMIHAHSISSEYLRLFESGFWEDGWDLTT